MAARHILILPVLLLTVACQRLDPGQVSSASPTSQLTVLPGSREYLVDQHLTLKNVGPGKPEKQNLWVALVRDFPPYQAIVSRSIAPQGYTLVADEFGNEYAEFDLSNHPAGMEISINITTQVLVNELEYDLADCTGSLTHEFLEPELHIESDNPQILNLARKLAAGESNPCQKVRSFYDYIGDELTYTFNGDNWGAQAALGPMGSDCTEYASLMAALSRAARIPARYFEGLHFLEDGETADNRVQHAWLDVYLPGIGWVGMDPTLGRLPINRDTYFAHYTPDHIIITLGSSPSTLRGSSYWTHLYWPGDATRINVEDADWKIELVSAAN